MCPPAVDPALKRGKLIPWNRCSSCAMRSWPYFATASRLTAAEQRHVLRARQRTAATWDNPGAGDGTCVFWSLGRWTKPRITQILFGFFRVSVFKIWVIHEKTIDASAALIRPKWVKARCSVRTFGPRSKVKACGEDSWDSLAVLRSKTSSSC